MALAVNSNASSTRRRSQMLAGGGGGGVIVGAAGGAMMSGAAGPAILTDGSTHAGDVRGTQAPTDPEARYGGEDGELSELEVQSLYAWIDEVQLSRPKKNFTRDFSDGVNAAEIIKHFLPKLVDLHNYSPANATAQKVYNWRTLNHKVFRRLSYSIGEDVIQAIVNCRPGFVEVVLNELRKRIDEYITRHNKGPGVVTWPEGSEPQFPFEQQLQHEQQQQQQQPQPQRQLAPMYTYAQPEQMVAPMHGFQGSAIIPGMFAAEMSGSKQMLLATTAPPADPGMGQGLPDATVAGIHVADFPYILQEKNRMIAELQDTVEILQLKVAKLEELLVLKNRRIEEMTSQLR